MAIRAPIQHSTAHPRNDLPALGESGDHCYRELLSISHEYHAWNVKIHSRVRRPHGYNTQWTYTRLLWLFEGSPATTTI